MRPYSNSHSSKRIKDQCESSEGLVIRMPDQSFPCMIHHKNRQTLWTRQTLFLCKLALPFRMCYTPPTPYYSAGHSFLDGFLACSLLEPCLNPLNPTQQQPSSEDNHTLTLSSTKDIRRIYER